MGSRSIGELYRTHRYLVGGLWGPERWVENRRAAARLQDILSKMNHDQRLTFRLYEIDGLNSRQIARLMKCPLSMVFSRLRQARVIFAREVRRLHRIDRAEYGS